jgi:hypothetical protein
MHELYKICSIIRKYFFQIIFIISLFIIVPFIDDIHILFSKLDEPIIIYIVIILIVVVAVLMAIYICDKNDEKVKQIRDGFLGLVSIILMYLASLFLGLQIMYKYFNYPLATQVATTTPNPLDNISNDTLLGILSLLTVFAGLLSYIFYRIVKRDIQDDIKKDYEMERKLSKIDLFIFGAYFHMRFYEIVCEEKTRTEDKDKKAIKEIDNALDKIYKAIDFLKGIEEEKCLREIFLAKNNLAYYLARKWNYYKDEKIDNSFKNYLEEDSERAKEYNSDKRHAEGCVKYLKNKQASEIYFDLSKPLEDTYGRVEKIFSISPKINYRIKTRPETQNE